jgi:flagellar biosynthesis/type III secretory pathway chaperone
MSTDWKTLAQSLREEALAYGALFNLFEEQQKLLFTRDAKAVFAKTAEIDDQVRVAAEQTAQRTAAVAAFAARHGIERGRPIVDLLQAVEPAAQGQIQALIDSLNQLIARVRRICKHNQLFLARTVESHQELIRAIRPGYCSRTYARSGSVATSRPEPRRAMTA